MNHERNELSFWNTKQTERFEHCFLRESLLRLRKEVFYNSECEGAYLFFGHERVQRLDNEVKCILFHLRTLVIDNKPLEDFESNVA